MKTMLLMGTTAELESGRRFTASKESAKTCQAGAIGKTYTLIGAADIHADGELHSCSTFGRRTDPLCKAAINGADAVDAKQTQREEDFGPNSELAIQVTGSPLRAHSGSTQWPDYDSACQVFPHR